MDAEIFIFVLLFMAGYLCMLAKKWWVRLIGVLLNILLVIVVIKAAYMLATIEGNIMQGGPAYFVLEDTVYRIEVGDPNLSPDLKDLIEQMHPKGDNGVNGEVMRKYTRERSKITKQLQDL